MAAKAIPLSTLRAQYPNQWILVEVVKEAPTGEVISGRLLAHSKDRDRIYAEQEEVPRYAYVTFTGPMNSHGLFPDVPR